MPTRSSFSPLGGCHSINILSLPNRHRMTPTYMSCLLSNGQSSVVDAAYSYPLSFDSRLNWDLSREFVQANLLCMENGNKSSELYDKNICSESKEIEYIVDMQQFDKEIVQLGFSAVSETETDAFASLCVPRSFYVAVPISSAGAMPYQDDAFSETPPDLFSTVGFVYFLCLILCQEECNAIKRQGRKQLHPRFEELFPEVIYFFASVNLWQACI